MFIAFFTNSLREILSNESLVLSTNSHDISPRDPFDIISHLTVALPGDLFLFTFSH